ncbi:MAG: hypothetical protein CM15mV130_310 [Caudoviricetes sp.]|nr:MAG: hypothetical protein CM15mV130_310 [Caudoviricetes sp.]
MNWDTDKANAVDLMKKVMQSQKTAPKKTADSKTGKENHSAYSLWRYEKKEKKKGSRRKDIGFFSWWELYIFKNPLGKIYVNAFVMGKLTDASQMSLAQHRENGTVILNGVTAHLMGLENILLIGISKTTDVKAISEWTGKLGICSRN